MILSDKNKVITDGIARSRSLFGVNLVDLRNRVSSPDSSFFAVWHEGNWVAGKSNESRITGLSTLGDPPNHFLLVSQDGEFQIVGGGVDLVERIPREIDQPITGLSVVNQVPYAYGMGRQVYRREAPDRWIPQHAQLLSTDNELVGIQALVDGDEPNSLYVGGWRGEIWYFNGQNWSNEDSPTNFILSDAVKTAAGDIVFCGRSGTVIRGHAGAWQKLETNNMDYGDFWSIVAYHDDLYLASQSELFRLVDTELEPVECSVEGYQRTHYRLQVVDDHLFSFGERDILTYDGKNWARIPTE